MSFPLNPTNGQQTQVNGVVYTYSSAKDAWTVGTLFVGNVTVDQINANSVVSAGNISGSYILGNGSQLTGLPEGYANVDVAAYLPTYTGNLVSLQGNITTTAAVSAATLSVTGNVTGGNIAISGIISTTGNILSSSTGFVQLPVGNTAQRPGSPSNGFIRKNSDTGYVEYYDSTGTVWRDIDRSPQIYNFSGTITFSNCGQSGPYGPVLANAVSSYSAQPFQSTWLNNQDLFNVVAGVQFWRVPKNGTYTVRVAGARSGSSTHGGLGRDLTSTFSLVAGEWLKIVCGQQGVGDSGQFSGGGGGSFVAVSRSGDWIPLLVAGGGAGVSGNSPQSTNTNRNGWSPGTRSNETRGGMGSWYNTSYGTQIGSYWPGGGGGGWASDGLNGQINIYTTGQATGGRALTSASPLGGIYTVNTSTFNGGFGGGGATGIGSGGAGGGGGWWGGNASFALLNSLSDDTTNLGGGSYSANPTFTDNGTRNGAGYASITLG